MDGEVGRVAEQACRDVFAEGDGDPAWAGLVDELGGGGGRGNVVVDGGEERVKAGAARVVGDGHAEGKLTVALENVRDEEAGGDVAVDRVGRAIAPDDGGGVGLPKVDGAVGEVNGLGEAGVTLVEDGVRAGVNNGIGAGKVVAAGRSTACGRGLPVGGIVTEDDGR